MNEFLSFRKMITPLVIQIIFWVLAAIVIIGGLVALVQGMVIQGLVMIVIGPIIVRIYCELIILAFRIYDELVMIRRGQTGEPQGFPVMPPAPTGAP